MLLNLGWRCDKQNIDSSLCVLFFHPVHVLGGHDRSVHDLFLQCVQMQTYNVCALVYVLFVILLVIHCCWSIFNIIHLHFWLMFGISLLFWQFNQFQTTWFCLNPIGWHFPSMLLHSKCINVCSIQWYKCTDSIRFIVLSI